MDNKTWNEYIMRGIEKRNEQNIDKKRNGKFTYQKNEGGLELTYN